MSRAEAARPPLDLGAIRLFLFDIDGVFLAGKSRPRLLSGRRALATLREMGLPFRLVTNTSTDRNERIAAGLRDKGIEVGADDVHSALAATIAAAAARRPSGRCFVFGEAGLRQAAQEAGLRPVDEPPADLVLVGLHRAGDYRALSVAARCLEGGAMLLGCHRNRMWIDDDGRAISCGPWLAALEHATGAVAETFGKPSAAFYEHASHCVGVPPRQILMVGDDLEADVLGAERCGMRTALVLTGKTSREALAASAVVPDLVLEEADALADLLREQGPASEPASGP